MTADPDGLKPPWFLHEDGHLGLRGRVASARFDATGITVSSQDQQCAHIPWEEVSLLAILLPHLGPLRLALLSVGSFVQTLGPRYSWGVDICVVHAGLTTSYRLGRPSYAPLPLVRRNAAFRLGAALGKRGRHAVLGDPALGPQLVRLAESVATRSESATYRALDAVIERIFPAAE